jgi:hypothetical protein
MLRITVTFLLAALLPAGSPPGLVPSKAPADTVQAGDHRLDASHLSAFALVRQMTLTRGDTAMPFGHQSEALTAATLQGRQVWLDVQTFESPRATTVDSSWVDARTARPIRLFSGNRSRTIDLQFSGAVLRGQIVPDSGATKVLDQSLAARPFEWNTFGLAVSALPLRTGYRVVMPVYSDRFGTVAWYTVEVVGDTTLTRASGFEAPMWQVVARSDAPWPTIRFWVSQRHRFVDRALLTETGAAMLYARDL